MTALRTTARVLWLQYNHWPLLFLKGLSRPLSCFWSSAHQLVFLNLISNDHNCNISAKSCQVHLLMRHIHFNRCPSDDSLPHETLFNRLCWWKRENKSGPHLFRHNIRISYEILFLLVAAATRAYIVHTSVLVCSHNRYSVTSVHTTRFWYIDR